MTHYGLITGSTSEKEKSNNSLAIQSHNEKEIEQGIREILAHRVQYVIATPKESAYLLATLDYFVNPIVA